MIFLKKKKKQILFFFISFCVLVYAFVYFSLLTPLSFPVALASFSKEPLDLML